MPVEQQTPFNEYTGNGVTTVFAFQFQVLIATDLAVFVDGALKANGTDYTITGVGNQQGGQVTFFAAPASGADVLLAREMVFARDTDYQTNGDLREAVLDRDFDRIWLVLQSLSANVSTSLRFPFPEKANELPAAGERANKLLSFNAAGQPVVSLPTSDSAQGLRLDLASPAYGAKGVAGAVYHAEDVSALSVEPPSAHRTTNAAVHIKGYYAGSSKGAGVLRWIPGDTTPSDGIAVFGGSGLSGRWMRDFQQIISAVDAGILGDGTSADLSRIQKLIDYADQRKLAIAWEPGVVLLSAQMWARAHTVMLSPAPGAVRLRVKDGVDAAVLGADPNIPVDIASLRNLILDANKANAPKASALSVCAWAGITEFVAEYCDFAEGTGYGLGFQGRPLSTLPAWQQQYLNRGYIDSCRFYHNGDGAPGEIHDGLDCKYATEIWITRSSSFSNADKGMDIRGKYVHMHKNNCESNTGDGMGIQTFHSDMGINTDTFLDLVGNTTRVNGGQGLQVSTGATTPTMSMFGSIANQTSIGDNNAGMLIEHETATLNVSAYTSRVSKYIGLRVKSCEELNVSGASINGSTNHGASFEVGAKSVSLTNFKSRGNGQFGVSNTSGVPIHFGGACDLSGNTSGPINSAGSSSFVSPIAGAVPTSATPTIANTTSTLQMPMGLDCAEVTSTVAMNNISQPYQGRLVTIVAGSGGLTFNASSALQTTSGASTVVAAGASITFRHANGKWYQV